jgi:hypothetical protein
MSPVTSVPTSEPTPLVTGEGSPDAVPTSSPTCDYVHSTAEPTPVPTITPTFVPTPIVTGQGSPEPGGTDDPTCEPDSVPTAASPTIAPSPAFDQQGTPPPEVHTYAPSPTVEESGSGTCEDAWVYCPGRSTCFNDSGFNGGVIAEGKWGWSIVFDPNEDDLVADCDIMIGAVDCDLNTATKVGSFQMRSNFGHYCMADYGYAATSFAFYSGSCAGNDGGASATTGQCSPTDVATSAATPESFPLYLMNENNEINFTMDATDPINTGSSNWPATHQLFPITALTHVSAYACVVPDPDNVFTGEGGSGILWNP